MSAEQLTAAQRVDACVLIIAYDGDRFVEVVRRRDAIRVAEEHAAAAVAASSVAEEFRP